MIRITRLDKYFNKGKSDELHVINDISLEFDKTGLVCIIGESGSGKTTLLNTIGGIDTFQNGNITIDDASFSGYSAKEMDKLRNEKFGYIFQGQCLLQGESVYYNILLALSMYSISEEEKEARIDYVLQAVGMKKYKKRLVSHLSGGQQQRVAIARALVKSPDIILADEPTANLNEANTLRIMSILKKISRNCLVILVTHEKSIAEFFADRIITFNRGVIENDTSHKGRKTYQYNDDTNLYLKEYDKETFQNNNIRINLYQGGENKEIVLNMVYTEGRLFIQAPSEDEVVLLTSADEMKMIDDVRPELNVNQVEDFEYNLEPIEKKREPSLTLKEVWRLATGNVSMIGKKQFFLILAMIITSILLVFDTADYMTSMTMDKKSVITENSHYIEVMGKRNSDAENEDYFNSFNSIYNIFVNSNVAKDIYIGLDSNLSFNYPDYGQLKNLSYTITDFSYVTLDHFNKKDLIYGRMPEKKNEIIIDKWLIDIFEKSDNMFRTLMPDMNSFINLEVTSDVSDQKLIIVGICNQDEPTIYIDKFAGISTATWADKIASLQQLQSEYPYQYDNIQLASDEVLVSESTYKQMKQSKEKKFHNKSGNDFNVAGTFPDEFGVTYVTDDKNYSNILGMYICNSRRFMIYNKDINEKKSMIQYLSKNRAGFDTTYVKLTVSDTYGKEIAKYNKERSVTMGSQNILTAIVLIFSLVMMYFTMKTNAMKLTRELSVYRLIGISKRSILTAFVFEIVIISSYTVLPVVLIASAIIRIIAAMPSLQLEIVYPWVTVIVLLAFLYCANILIGIIPIYDLIKRPPAQISGRE